MGDYYAAWGKNCTAREMKVYCNKRNCIAILVLYRTKFSKNEKKNLNEIKSNKIRQNF